MLFEDANYSNTNPKISKMGSIANYIAIIGISIVVLLVARDFFNSQAYNYILILAPVFLFAFFALLYSHRRDKVKYYKNEDRINLSIDDHYNLIFNNSNEAPVPLKSVKQIFIVEYKSYFVLDNQVGDRMIGILDKISKGNFFYKIYRTITFFSGNDQFTETHKTQEHLYYKTMHKFNRFKKSSYIKTISVFDKSALAKILQSQGFKEYNHEYNAVIGKLYFATSFRK